MAKKKKKSTKKKATKKACCSHEEKYKEMPYEDKITELVRCGILQDLDSVEKELRSFDEWVGEMDVIGSEYDKFEQQTDPSLADVRNFAVELGVIPFGCPELRKPERFGFVPSMLFYGPKGSGKTMISRSIASSCGARWFDLSPSRICQSGLMTCKKDIEMIVHLTFHVAKYLKPSVIYIDEIEKIFEGGKGHTGAHPTFMLDPLKKHISKAITKISRVLVIGNTSKPFMAKEMKSLKNMFTTDTENKELRYMCYCPWPDNYHRHLLWRKFIAACMEKNQIQIDVTALENSGELDISLLAKCSNGYSAGNIRQAVNETLNYRRIQKYIQLKKGFHTEEFLNHLSKTEYCYSEDFQNFQNFRAEVTCRELALDAIKAKREALENGDAEPKKKGGKKKK